MSTSDGQTVANQERELQAVAERHGWQVVATFADEGVSGARSRDQRPAMARLMQAVARREIDLVASWSVCRLGRSLPDLIGFLGELRATRDGLTPEGAGSFPSPDRQNCEARRIIEAWRIDYNTERPHTSLNGLTPIEFATRPTEGQNTSGLYL